MHLFRCVLIVCATNAVRAENIAFKLLNPHSPQPEVQFIYAGKALGRFKVDILPTNTPYFHWAYSGKRVDTWTKAGRVPIEEMENRTKGTGDKLLVGGGVYTSYDSTDSDGFGDRLMVFNAPQRLLALQHPGHDQIVAAVLKREKPQAMTVNRINAALRKAGLQGVNYNLSTGQRYSVWFSPVATSKVHEATFDDLVSHTRHLTLTRLIKSDLHSPVQHNPHSDAFLQKSYPAIYKILNDEPLNKSEREQLEFMLPRMSLWPLDKFKSPFAMKIQRAIDVQRQSEEAPPEEHQHSTDPDR